MSMRLRAVGGTMAVYDYTAGDDAPFSAPLSNIARLRFHSGLNYPAIINTVTGTLNLPAVGTNTSHRRVQYTLFAHGRPGIPYVEGAIVSGLGQVVGLCGSVPVQTGTSLGAAFPRMLSLGADGTNVYLVEYGTTHETFGWASLSLDWRVYVLDTLVA